MSNSNGQWGTLCNKCGFLIKEEDALCIKCGSIEWISQQMHPHKYRGKKAAYSRLVNKRNGVSGHKNLPDFTTSGKEACYVALLNAVDFLDGDGKESEEGSEVRALTFPGDSVEFEKRLYTKCMSVDKSLYLQMVEQDKKRFKKHFSKFIHTLPLTDYRNMALRNGEAILSSGNNRGPISLNFDKSNFIWLDFMSAMTKGKLKTLKELMKIDIDKMVLSFTLGIRPGADDKVLEGYVPDMIRNAAKYRGWSSVVKDIYMEYKGAHGTPMYFYQFLLSGKETKT